jgi:hypothetical protein
MASPRDADMAVFRTLVRRLEEYAEGRELIPWEGGLADLQPHRGSCRVDAYGINDQGTWGLTTILKPVHERSPFAVYLLPDGSYVVVGDGPSWGKPYATEDIELATAVCDRWAADLT